MANNEYDFHFVPLEGKLPGLKFQKQTEDAINDIGNRLVQVEENSEATLDDAQQAVEKATEAIETANNADTKAQTALDEIDTFNPKTHFIGVNSSGTEDLNYNGGGAVGTDSISIGKSASATAEDSIAIGKNSVATTSGEVSIGVPSDGVNAEVKRKITHVADGVADSDAVSKGQMDTAIGSPYTAGNGIDVSSGRVISAVAGTNITVDSSGINAPANGLVASADTGLLGGGTAYTELRPTRDGTWVKTAQTTAVNLEKLEGGLEYAYAVLSRQYDQLKKYINGNYYDYQTDSSSAYTKSVPSGAMPYAGLEKVGGKTVVWNQLVDSGTTTVNTISGHKYYTLIDGTASIVTADGTAISVVDDTADMVCDLTLMFGSGNEPSTTADFTAIFGATHYAYNAGTLLSAGVTSVVSKDSTDTEIATYPIPASIQALEGYGWSAGTAYNYIDYETRKFVQKVVSVTLNGTESWSKTDGSGGNAPYYALKVGEEGDVVNGQVIANKININTAISVSNSNIGLNCSNSPSVHAARIIIRPPSLTTDITTFKAWLAGDNITVYYALTTPLETDISSYITDDNLIEVDAGGTLTFPNSNGTDYQIPVPSEETYMIDLQSALGE